MSSQQWFIQYYSRTVFNGKNISCAETVLLLFFIFSLSFVSDLVGRLKLKKGRKLSNKDNISQSQSDHHLVLDGFVLEVWYNVMIVLFHWNKWHSSSVTTTTYGTVGITITMELCHLSSVAMFAFHKGCFRPSFIWQLNMVRIGN